MRVKRALSAGIAQSVEQLIRNQQVGCSSHLASSIKITAPYGAVIFMWFSKKILFYK